MTTDINIINVNGLDYPIKDQEARDVAESAVKIFAYYEDGLVASQAYATIGTPICWKGELYYTTTTVAKGNIWAVGVNLRVGDKAGLIINRINDVESELTANGNRIYMDYKNGKYGYNTSPSRGADTFFPFNRADHVRLNLYGYAYGWAEEYGNAHAKTTGRGTYILSGSSVDHVTGVSGSMTVTYTNAQGQSTSQTLTAGQTITIGNSNDVKFSWEASGENRRYSGEGNAETSVSASVVVDVYF